MTGLIFVILFIFSKLNIHFTLLADIQSIILTVVIYSLHQKHLMLVKQVRSSDSLCLLI